MDPDNVQAIHAKDNLINSNNKVKRKLASIQIIKDVKKLQNSDKLSIAYVLGWQVVIGLNQFKKGEKVIYIEVDSLLPSDKEWTQPYKDKKFKIKTCKIRGELSQGLIVSLKCLKEHKDINDNQYSDVEYNYKEGDNVTDFLEIRKYNDDSELNQELATTNLHSILFPLEYGFTKTDEDRIQSVPEFIDKFQGHPYYATLKYDGMSATYFLNIIEAESKHINKNHLDFYILSRNKRRPYIKNNCSYSKIADKYNIKEKLLKLNANYAIQGEIYGPKIQNNKLKIKDIEFVVFSVFSKQDNKYLDYLDLIKFCKEQNLPMVETILEGNCFKFKLDELKNLAKGNYPNTNNMREGLVFRTKIDWCNNNINSTFGGNRMSFKIINDEFLLKNN